MVRSCSAYGCTARAVAAGGTRRFHRFPVNPVRRKKWIRATRRKDFTPSSGSYICSDHFADDAYDESRTSGFCSRRFLKPDAVPTIFAFPDYLLRKKVKTEPALDEKYPQSTADVEVTTATDQVDVNNRPTSSSPESIEAPTIQYFVVEPTSWSYLYSDNFLDEACDESKTSGFCSGGYLEPDAIPGSVSVFPDRLPPMKANNRKTPLNQKCSQSTADVETTSATEHIDVNSIPTSSSLESIKAPRLRYVGDCIPKDTDSLTDTKDKLHFVLSAYHLQQKHMKVLMQKVRRTKKRYIIKFCPLCVGPDSPKGEAEGARDE